jgi:MFS family permease
VQIAQVLLLVAISVSISAVIGAITGQKLQRLYKEELYLGVNAVGTLGILAGIPSYIQPFMGAWADIFPLFGFRRRTYYVLGSIIEALGFYGLSVLPHNHYWTVVCLVIVYATGSMMLGVMTNAVMVAVGNPTGTFGWMQSLASFMPLILGLVYTADLRAYTVVHWTYAHCFWVAMALCLLRAPCALLMEERRVRKPRRPTPEELAHHREDQWARRERTRAALRRAAASPGLWAIAGYAFYLILTPGINNAIYYYQKDVLHLSDGFIGHLSRWGSAGTLIGLLLFAVGSRRLPVRSLVWGAFLMDCFCYPTLMLMNDAVSAKVVTLVYAAIGVLYNLCLYTLAARACPPGIEGMAYGLVLAAMALGGTLSEKLGAFLYDFFGPKNPVHHYSIAHGWYWALGVGLAFTVLAAGFIPFLPAWTRSREPLAGLRAQLQDPDV